MSFPFALTVCVCVKGRGHSENLWGVDSSLPQYGSQGSNLGLEIYSKFLFRLSHLAVLNYEVVHLKDDVFSCWIICLLYTCFNNAGIPIRLEILWIKCEPSSALNKAGYGSLWIYFKADRGPCVRKCDFCAGPVCLKLCQELS